MFHPSSAPLRRLRLPLRGIVFSHGLNHCVCLRKRLDLEERFNFFFPIFVNPASVWIP
jgi:hypothetical protein